MVAALSVKKTFFALSRLEEFIMNTNLAANYGFIRLIYLFALVLLTLLPCSCTAQQNKPATPKSPIRQATPVAEISPGTSNAEPVKCKSREEIETERPTAEWKGSELNKAILRRDVAAVKRLLKQNADPNEKDNHDDPPLINAVRGMKITEPVKPGESKDVRRGKLEKEAQAQVQIVEALLKSGADTSLRGYLGSTPLIESAFWVYNSNYTVKILTLLIRHKADINAQDERGFTALINAVYAGKPETVKFLLAQGANAELTTCEDESALTIAQSRKAADIVALLQSAK